MCARKREPARRILAKLISEQRERPGQGVSLEVLREAAWPGEKMTRAAARNRIYVALNQLRNLVSARCCATRRALGGYRVIRDLPPVRVRAVAVDPDVD